MRQRVTRPTFVAALVVAATLGGLSKTRHATATSCDPGTLREAFEQADVVAEFYVIDMEPMDARGETHFRARLGRVFKGGPAVSAGLVMDVFHWSLPTYLPPDAGSFAPGTIGFFERRGGALASNSCSSWFLSPGTDVLEQLRRATRRNTP